MPRTAKEWVRDPSDELALSEGCYFDEAAGRHTCDFLETYCFLSEGDWAGKPLRLIPWQRDATMRLYGWKRADGRRRFRRAYIEVAKKNGKSPWVSGLSNYHLVADGEGGPKIYLNACDREQARIVFDHAANMVRQSPDLRSITEIVESRHRIVCKDNAGSIVANSAVVDAKDGRNASLVEFDELHRLPDRKLWNVFKFAGASRSQPLTLAITTAGEAEEGVWHDQRQYTEKVLKGEIPDTTHFGVVYRALPADDVDDPATWRKANPSFGFTLREDTFKLDLEEAKLSPLDWNEFLRLRLNIVAAGAAAFFPAGAWDACAGPVDERALAGKPCWVGVDLSSVNDLTAVVAVFKLADGSYAVLARFYLPADSIVDLERQHRQPYRRWADLGDITLTPGSTVDYDFIRRDVNDLARRFAVQKVLIDPCNATQLAIHLRDRDGLPVEEFRQRIDFLNAPTKELLRLAMSGLLRHGGHPVLRWNAGNCVAYKDVNENIRITKDKGRRKIDGISALINALAAAMSDGQDEPVYTSERGLIVF